MSRISSGTMTVAIFALLLGLAGAYTVRQYMQPAPKAEAAAPKPPVNQGVAFASNDLIPGKVISFGDIVVMSLSPEQVKRRKLPPDAMTNTRFIIGRTLKTPLKKGDPFLTTDLYPEGMGPSVVERLKPGLRALTIPVNDLAAVSGFATPGSTVDVLFRSEESDVRPETLMTIVENVEVLAHGQSVVPGMKDSTTAGRPTGMVTLAVSPEQAASLQVAIGHGELSLALRNPGDATLATGERSRMTLDRLMGIEGRNQPRRIEVFHGGSRQILQFQDNAFLDERFSGRNAEPIRTSQSAPAQSAPAATPNPAAAAVPADRAGG